MLIFILFISLVISLGGLLGWALYRCGFGISPRLKTVSYYAVCFGEFDTKEQAETFAQSLQLKGGAGFIAGENNMVLASIYSTKEQAESVINNNTDYSGKVVVIDINDDYKNEQKILNNLINLYIDYDKTQDASLCIKSLDDICALAREQKFSRAGFYNHLSRMVNVVKNMQSNLGYGLKYLSVSVADFLAS